MKKLQIIFWKAYSKIWEIKPTRHLPKYQDYSIASCDIAENYSYPDGFNVLFEWDEKGLHWIVITRSPVPFIND